MCCYEYTNNFHSQSQKAKYVYRQKLSLANAVPIAKATQYMHVHMTVLTVIAKKLIDTRSKNMTFMSSSCHDHGKDIAKMTMWQLCFFQRHGS